MSFVYADPGGVGMYIVEGWTGAVARFTTRKGGVSVGPYCCLNLGSGGGDSTEAVGKNVSRLAHVLGIRDGSLFRVKQVHSDAVFVVRSPGEDPPENGFDAMVTDVPGLALGVLVADCVPILLYDPVRRAVGAVHAGWKGTVSGIVSKAVAAMKDEYGSEPSDILAAIGPSIGPCCYEVDEKVVVPLGDLLGEIEGFITPHGKGKWLLDLWKTNEAELTISGLPVDNIRTLGMCTSCNPQLFYSYRREGQKTGRMMGLVMLEGDA